MPVVSQQDLEHMLDVTEVSESVFTGPNLAHESTRVFGGQLIAQIIGSVSQASPEMTVRSAHVVFLREGALDQDISYHATALKRGRSFDTWSVDVRQNDRSMASALVSMSADLGAFDVSAPRPDRPDKDHATAVDLQLVPWETRMCDGHGFAIREAVAGELSFWMNLDAGSKQAPWHRQAMVGHVTDLMLIATALLPLDGWSIDDAHAGLTTAVTAHTIWFHRVPPSSGWLLFDQSARSVAGEVASATGDVWTEQGDLLVSYAQECLIRVNGSRTT
jgi:acyl-CoA thioesterase-2